MYVASLNLDLFFKKVFSNKRIAKHFLEDFLGVHISEITVLSTEKRVTDDATVIKFDYRCKIHGKYVIIEMQQKYKPDVVKRFFLYQALLTALQLETLKPIEITKEDGKKYTEKQYSEIEPAITIVWMVDDNLGFKEDFVAYSTIPEATKNFVLDNDLWKQPLDSILEERKKVQKILENKTKGLDFMGENRLIFAFQSNIAKSMKKSEAMHHYYKWFEVAELSKNPNNTEEDFSKYKMDKDMTEVLNRIRKDKLNDKEFEYVSDIYRYELYMKIKEEEYAKKLEKQKKKFEKIEQKVEQAEQKVEQAEQKIQQADKEIEQEKQKAEQLQNKLLRLIKMLLNQGDSIPSIADALELSVEETTELVKLI